MTLPARGSHQSFAEHQAEVAAWLGTDVMTMNVAHDALHRALCKWLGITSHSLAGEQGDPVLAGLEEDAVLYVQRLLVRHGVKVPA